MRVLHVVWAFSPLTETFIYDSVIEASRRVDDTLVVAHRRENERDRPFERVRLLPDAPRWSARDLWNKARWLVTLCPDPDITFASKRRALRGMVADFHPDVIHAHFGPQGVLAAGAVRGLGVPVLTSFYGYDVSESLRSPRWRRWYRDLWSGANSVLVLSNAMRAAVQEVGCPRDRVAVVPFGKRLSEYPFRLRASAPRRFVSVGRLVEKKGHLDAIQAIAANRARGVEASLTIIGEGELEGALRDHVARARLEDCVRLVGALPHRETVRHMSEADAFILCSRTGSTGDQEGVPTVLMEAQALGLPCVTTWHAGIPEVIPEANHSLLAPEGDVAAIAAIIRRLVDAPAPEIEGISRRGAEHIRENYELARVTERLLAAYRSACAGAAAPRAGQRVPPGPDDPHRR